MHYIISISILSLCFSCSAVFMTPPPENFKTTNNTNYDCSTNKTLPVIDSILGGGEFLYALIYTQPLGYATGLIYFISSSYGFETANDCKYYKRRVAILEEHEEEEKEDELKEIERLEKEEERELNKVEPRDKSKILELAKRCQDKGGVWINDRCEIILENTDTSDAPVAPLPKKGESTEEEMHSDIKPKTRAPKQMSVKELHEAAKKGNRDAQYKLGWKYQNGIDVKINDAKAKYWYKKCATAGEKFCQLRLDEMD